MTDNQPMQPMPDPLSPDPVADQDDAERLDAHLRHMAEEQFRRQMRQASYLLSEGNGKDALLLLQRCYQLHPDDVNVLTNLGSAYILMLQPRRAVPFLERASQLAPDNPAVWTNLAVAYLGNPILADREQQDRALAAYQRVIALEPDYPNVHYNTGLIYLDQGDLDAAYTAFSRAIESNPHDDDAQLMCRRVDEARRRPSGPPVKN